MYDAPLHMTSDPGPDPPQGRIPPGDVGERATPVIRDRIPPIPGRLLLENTGRGRGRGGYIASLFARPSEDRYHSDPPRDCPERESYSASVTRPTEDRVRINSPQVQDSMAEEKSQDDDKYQEGPAGISAYRVSQGPPTSGLWNAEHYHYAVMLKHIRKLIIWKVRTPLTAPPGVKQPKVSDPAKYSGNKNHDSFLLWLNQFLNWLRMHYYCGPDAEFSRLSFLGNYVEGIAADWYAAEIDNPDKMADEPIKFIDAVCMMHRQFVRTATANNAVTQYDKVECSPLEGVEGFYYRLDKMANRMVERPSDYSF
jgi:hypothetical protein